MQEEEDDVWLCPKGAFRFCHHLGNHHLDITLHVPLEEGRQIARDTDAHLVEAHSTGVHEILKHSQVNRADEGREVQETP